MVLVGAGLARAAPPGDDPAGEGPPPPPAAAAPAVPLEGPPAPDDDSPPVPPDDDPAPVPDAAPVDEPPAPAAPAAPAGPVALDFLDVIAPPLAAVGACAACGVGGSAAFAGLAGLAVLTTASFFPLWQLFQALVPFMAVGTCFGPSCLAGGLGPAVVGGSAYLAGFDLDENVRRMIAMGALPALVMGGLAAMGMLGAGLVMALAVTFGSGPLGPTTALATYALLFGLFAAASMWAANVLAPPVAAAGVITNSLMAYGLAPDPAVPVVPAPPMSSTPVRY